MRDERATLSLAAFLFLIYLTPLEAQTYIICRKPISHDCLTWKLDMGGQDNSLDDFPTSSDYICGFVSYNPRKTHTKFITVDTLSGLTKTIFCKHISVINGVFQWGQLQDLQSVPRVRRQVTFTPRGRYRGQTQSQYLAIDRGNGKDEGKAEAHSAADSSRASVSGNSGMGQAQSQSIYDPSCDGCNGKSEQEDSLRKIPENNNWSASGPAYLSRYPGRNDLGQSEYGSNQKSPGDEHRGSYRPDGKWQDPDVGYPDSQRSNVPPSSNTGPAPNGQQTFSPGQQGYIPGKTPSLQRFGPGQRGYAQGREGYIPGQQGQTPNQRGYAPGHERYIPGQQGQAPGQRGYAPGHVGYIPSQQSQTPGQQGYALGRDGYLPDQQGHTPGQQGYATGHEGYIPGPQGHTPDQQGYAPGNERYIPGQQGQTPGQQGYAPGNERYIPGQQGQTPGQRGYAPGHEGYIPGQQGYTPGLRGQIPRPQDYTPGQQGYMPGQKIYTLGQQSLSPGQPSTPVQQGYPPTQQSKYAGSFTPGLSGRETYNPNGVLLPPGQFTAGLSMPGAVTPGQIASYIPGREHHANWPLGSGPFLGPDGKTYICCILPGQDSRSINYDQGTYGGPNNLLAPGTQLEPGNSHGSGTYYGPHVTGTDSNNPIAGMGGSGTGLFNPGIESKNGQNIVGVAPGTEQYGTGQFNPGNRHGDGAGPNIGLYNPEGTQGTNLGRQTGPNQYGLGGDPGTGLGGVGGSTITKHYGPEDGQGIDQYGPGSRQNGEHNGAGVGPSAGQYDPRDGQKTGYNNLGSEPSTGLYGPENPHATGKYGPGEGQGYNGLGSEPGTGQFGSGGGPGTDQSRLGTSIGQYGPVYESGIGQFGPENVQGTERNGPGGGSGSGQFSPRDGQGSKQNNLGGGLGPKEYGLAGGPGAGYGSFVPGGVQGTGQNGPGSGPGTGQFGPGGATETGQNGLNRRPGTEQFGPGIERGTEKNGPNRSGGQFSPGGTQGTELNGPGSGPKTGQFGPGAGPGTGQYGFESRPATGQFGPGSDRGTAQNGLNGGSSGIVSPLLNGNALGKYPYNLNGGAYTPSGSGDSYNNIPQNYINTNTVLDGDDSEAEAIVSRAANGTAASASSKGGNDKGKAQTHVEGTYSGSGSFQAQAQITGENKGAESEVSGGKKGATSAATGSGRNNKSQASVQLGSETGAVQTNSQSSGTMHSSNSQVQGSIKGGMADAQARGPGSTSSQAQIGFTPFKDTDKAAHDLQKTPFVGGGIASAHSSGRTGQSQSQLHGTFKYGITYNGAAQSGASLDKDAVYPNRLSFKNLDVFDEKEKNIDVDVTELPKGKSTEEVPDTTQALPNLAVEDQKETEVTTTEKSLDEASKDVDSNYDLHPHADHHQDESPPSGPTLTDNRRSFHTDFNEKGTEYEYTTDKDENDDYDGEGAFAPDASDGDQGGDYSGYDEYPRGDAQTHQSLQSPSKKTIDVRQTTGGSTQHILLGSLGKHDAEITQKSSERPDERRVYQPGERIPGTGGYTIPMGFTGSVKSVASKEKTYVVGSRTSPSQAQTVTLTPGTGQVRYSHPSSYSRYVSPSKLRSLQGKRDDDRYVSVSKSVTRALDNENNVKKQYSHTYYTKSSSCGYFTFTCTMVSSAEGKKKLCKPKIPTNPDGTPIRC
ncbi:unnamed protein product [Leptosia nina]|uniref:Uncharacterized protein n=1 Tax=Leptosia nina TaxID=320188 RepID=A0AAV1K3T4_9NEOP